MRPRRPRTLYRQVLGHGVRLLFAVAVALAVAAAALGHAGVWRPHPTNFAQHAGALLSPLDDTAAAAQLGAIADALEVDLALYRDDGRRVAAAGEAAQPALDARDREALRRHGVVRGGPLGATATAGDGRYLRLRYRRSGGDLLLRTLGFVALLVAAVGLASRPLARAIARPLERLTAVARRLGGGDLAARAGLPRGDEVGELGAAFDEMAERLSRLVSGQRELIAAVSHELRTPLARMRVALALAAEAPPEQALARLEEVEHDVEELERLVETLLASSRLDALGALALRRETVAVRALADGAAERFARRHAGRVLDLAVEGETDRVEVEEPLLARAVDNLLENAARFSDPPRPIGLAFRVGAARLAIEVTDRGIGMSTDDLARAGTPFFRADDSRARGTGGVGLGLAFARRIAEAHGGRLALASEVGAGTTATLEFPLAR